MHVKQNNNQICIKFNIAHLAGPVELVLFTDTKLTDRVLPGSESYGQEAKGDHQFHMYCT